MSEQENRETQPQLQSPNPTLLLNLVSKEKAQSEPLQNASYPTECKSLTRKKTRPNQDLDVKIILLLCVSWRFIIYMLEPIYECSSFRSNNRGNDSRKHNQQGKGLVDLLAVHSKCTFAFALPRNITELLQTYLYTSHKHYINRAGTEVS